MMSPLTVSQLLDPEVFHFDIAIFDEASQIPPEYAVGTFMRADQVIIAGDRHQLPPTRFFQALETDNFDELKIGNEMGVTVGTVRKTADGRDVKSYKFYTVKKSD